MSQQELLKKLVTALDNAAIDYMVTGSIASSLQGEPRLTHDIDFVIVIDEAGVRKLHASFPSPDYYLDEQSVTDALIQKGMFNLLDVASGDKADFWVLTNSPFDRSRFARRQAKQVQGTTIKVSSPEDTILAKLWWATQSGGSEKQFTDALRVYELQFDKLDKSYLESWAEKLGVGCLLRRLRQEAEPL